jgi:phage tail protein X
MKKIIASQNQRLDEIVLSEYGTLSVFEKVLESNKHLSEKIFLQRGDEVNIPVIEIEKAPIKDDELW